MAKILVVDLRLGSKYAPASPHWNKRQLSVLNLAFTTPISKEKRGTSPKSIEIFYPNFSDNLRATPNFIYPKNCFTESFL